MKLKPGESIKWMNDDSVMSCWSSGGIGMTSMIPNDEGLDVVRRVGRNNMRCDMGWC